jgi:fido (protein-threonine AMPylation protein)
MYDYINNFNFEKDYFNIFTTSLILHQKLYSKCIGKNFGGNLRDSQVVLFGTNIEVVDSKQAIIEFNKYIKKSNEIMEDLENSDLISYINKSIRLITELIKLQPFLDGNKRTFRALFNLLLKKINLPPVYINKEDKKIYKEALIKAMANNEYNDLIKFYYSRIYDAIIKLDIDDNEREKKKIKL